MKNIKAIACFLAALLILGATSCTSMLDEEPRSELTPEFLKTPAGIRGSVVSAYSGLRWMFGPDGALCFTIPGTDEFMTTNMLNGTQASFDTYDQYLAPSNGSTGNFWNNGLQFVNMCNAAIDFAEASEELVEEERTVIYAEARFLRGFYYYLLTMYYGDVPLDLGSGSLKVNLTPSTTSVRNSRADVFKVIIDDLTYAKDNLPDSPSAVGHAAKPAAYHFLAKAYLTRANLPIAESSDYQNAYNFAKELIDNQSRYNVSLQQNYADVHLEGNENDSEILFNVQRTWAPGGPNLEFDESNDGPNAVSNKGNRANFFFTAGYENVQIIGPGGSAMAIVPRSLVYQRPWRMLLPTEWLVKTAFAEKTNDARWDGSFRTVWNAGVDFRVGGRSVAVGEKAIEISLDSSVEALAGDSVAANGVIYKPYAVYNWDIMYNADGSYNNATVQYVYPTLTKYDDTQRAALNFDSNRPYILARLAETYLIAAEAGMNIGSADANELVNVVRRRAAYREGLSASELATRQAAMEFNGTLTIDFILDERAREMCGESWRWVDLVRTNTLIDRVQKYNPRGSANIKAHHVLRPLPQEQIDLLTDEAQKAGYQNPNY